MASFVNIVFEFLGALCHASRKCWIYNWFQICGKVRFIVRGLNLLKKSIFRLTKDWQRFKDELDVMKFICKEFWSTVFKKQIDNLRTNHQGVYVLLDNRFKFITQMSNSKQYMDLMPKVNYFASRTEKFELIDRLCTVSRVCLWTSAWCTCQSRNHVHCNCRSGSSAFDSFSNSSATIISDTFLFSRCFEH